MDRFNFLQINKLEHINLKKDFLQYYFFNKTYRNNANQLSEHKAECNRNDIINDLNL